MLTVKTLTRLPQDRERRASARMTGRYLMTIDRDAHQHISSRLASINLVAATAPSSHAVATRALPSNNYMMLPKIGVGVVDIPPDQGDALYRMAAEENAVFALEPERIVRAVGMASPDYLHGWRDATQALSEKLLGDMSKPLAA